MSKVSVIVPVYNVERYLRECLDSILGQTLRDIEVICVDDGSTDSCASILADCAARDSRMKVLRQKNLGAGAARNAGLDRASGEWLAFLDADDVFSSAMLQDMACAGDASGADVVTCTEARRGDVFSRWKGWAWDKMFRREFIVRTGLRFQEIPVSNDLFFTYAALLTAGKTVSVAKDYVYHRKRRGSVETTRDSAPMAPLEAAKALYEKVGMVDGFARWVPDFLFWHINRMRSPDARRELYRATEAFGRELGIRCTGKWLFEEAKHAVRTILRRVPA